MMGVLKHVLSRLLREKKIEHDVQIPDLIPKVYVGRIEFEEDNASMPYSGEGCSGDCITIDLSSGACPENPYGEEPDDASCEIVEADISMFDDIINKYM